MAARIQAAIPNSNNPAVGRAITDLTDDLIHDMSAAGRVEKYWPDIGVAAVCILAGKLKIGDEVYIQGDRTGIKRAKINSMEIDKKKVYGVKKGQLVGIKLPKCYKGDDVFLINEKE